MCLNELSMCNKMVDLTRNNLFPTSEEVAALSLQFGLPVSVDGQSPLLLPGLGPGNEGGGAKEGGGASVTPERPITPYVTPRTKRVWLYLDDSNPEYDEVLRQRKKSKEKDFVQMNIVSTKVISLPRH